MRAMAEKEATILLCPVADRDILEAIEEVKRKHPSVRIAGIVHEWKDFSLQEPSLLRAGIECFLVSPLTQFDVNKAFVALIPEYRPAMYMAGGCGAIPMFGDTGGLLEMPPESSPVEKKKKKKKKHRKKRGR